jgi:hydroxymethylpyrimidine pyrophosphatase-like HAD family hydrolase
MKHKILIPLAVLVVLGGIVLGSSRIYAESYNGGEVTIIQKIAQRFGVSESDVQAVFDEMHKDRQDQMKVQMENSLNTLVTEGKITEEQKQAILVKQTELQESRDAKRETMKDMTPEQRKEQMDKQKQALEAWAAEHGIDLSLFPFMGHMKGKHMGEKVGFGR